MATVTAVETNPGRGIRKSVWSTLANGDVGNGVCGVAALERSIQVEGTFGAGGNVKIEGSNDGTNWRILSTGLGSAGDLSFTSAGIKTVSEAAELVRPNVTAGDGTTSLTITLVRKS